MKRILATAATALTGLGLALTSAAPAQASDATLKFFDSAGNVVAKAWYDDLTDNLCVVSYRDRQTATVQIGGQRMSAASPDSLSAGQSATLSVRPEAIRVRRSDAEAPPGIEAKVAEVIYLGSSIRVGSAIEGGSIVWADLRDEEAEGLVPGMDVRLAWPSTAIVWKETSK